MSKNTIIGVLRGVVLLSFEALEEEAPILVLSNFLITDAVNLLSSLIGVKLTDIWSDLGVYLFLSALFNAEGLLLIGVMKLSFLQGAVDLTGVEVKFEVPLLAFKNLMEEAGGFFLLVDANISWS